MIWLLHNKKVSGIFNVGTGKSRTFFDLVNSVYKKMSKNTNIKFINMPLNIKNQYQYVTEANISNIRQAGYKDKFYSIEEGISDYIDKIC